MSGKRQHFVPRFLQEGFASHANRGELFTWLYRKKTRPINTNIVNVGIEGFFYTNGNDTKADDLITTAEEIYSNLVKELRTSSPMRVSDPRIPELIAHLEVRTRHLRQNFSRTGNYILSRFLDFMCDEDFFAGYLERALRNDPSILRKAIADELEKRDLPKAILETMMEVSSPLLPALIEQMMPTLRQGAEYLRCVLPTKLSGAAKSGHISALKKDKSPKVRLLRYKDLTYEVVDVQESSLILGDSAVLFHVEGPKPFKTFIDKDDGLNAVILPLTSRRLLVGAREGFSVSGHIWPEAIARCSLEYFIANENSYANLLLQGLIGEDADLLTRAELEDIISEIMNE
ncbi:MAG: DUF4238 domain-containing protein [Phycisphaerae bacterium]